MFKIYVTLEDEQRIKLATIDTNNMQMINCVRDLLYIMREGGMLNDKIKKVEIVM